jgi:putative chitobiose transport system substrate-binding protein
LVPGESLVATHRHPIEYYKQGRLAILLTGPQFIGQIKSDSPEIYENTAIAPMPAWRGDRRFNAVLHSIVVSSQTKHPQEAADFAQYVTNWESQLAFCKQVTILPSTVKSLEDPYFTHSDGSLEGQCRMITAEQIKDSVVFRPLPDSRMLLTVLNQYTEAVASGEMEADEALKKAQEKWNAILK